MVVEPPVWSVEVAVEPPDEVVVEVAAVVVARLFEPDELLELFEPVEAVEVAVELVVSSFETMATLCLESQSAMAITPADHES